MEIIGVGQHCAADEDCSPVDSRVLTNDALAGSLTPAHGCVVHVFNRRRDTFEYRQCSYINTFVGCPGLAMIENSIVSRELRTIQDFGTMLPYVDLARATSRERWLVPQLPREAGCVSHWPGVAHRGAQSGLRW